MKKNLFELFDSKELPEDEELQQKADGFANNGKSTPEYYFRAGFYIGRNYEKYREILTGEEVKEND